MAVGFSNTNKPLNPRGNDQSPLAFNRAKLYSGKALDFDGVNDVVTISDNAAVDFGTSDFSIAFIMQSDTAGYGRVLDKRSATNGYTISIDTNKKMVLEMNVGAGNLGFITSKIYADGELKHVVISADRDGNASFYINGVLDEEIDISSRSGDLDSTSDLFIGADAPTGSGLFYNGSIAGVKMYSTALTAAQVADLYNNPEKVVPTGVDNTALKLWLPMMEGAGTYCINGADPLGDDVYNGAGSFDSATGWTLNTGTSITGGKLVVDGTQTITTSAYYNVSSLGSKLVLAEFTLSNVTSGQAQLAFFAASGTTTKWYTESGTYTELVEVGSGHNGNTGFIMNSSFVGDIDNLTIKEVSTGAISGATWTHGIGAPVAQTAVIDWNKKRTSNTIDVLLPQGLTTGRDITGVNLFENVRKQGALNLDGNSRALVHDNASLDYTSAATLESWVYWTGEGDQGILGRWFSPDSQKSLMLYASDSNSVRVYYSNDGVASFNKEASQTLSVGNWYHFVTTYDGSTIKIYVNAVEGNSAAYSSDIYVSSKHVDIGTYQEDLNKAYNGQIAQPRIYNRALTAAEVLRNYNSGKNTYK